MVKRTRDGIICTVCGQASACAPTGKIRTLIVQASGKPTMRSILSDGVEIHRCPVGALRGGRSPTL